MPRIAPRLLRLAKGIDANLARLLPICRSVDSAQSELRWLTQSISAAGHQTSQQNDRYRQVQLRRLVARRAKGEPLQYILGSEFFGDLEIKCRHGVLIPRQETAAAVSHLVHRLGLGSNKVHQHLRVLDLCTGSGCIPLLFHHDFYQNKHHQQAHLDILGIDISPTALSLATENCALQMQQLEDCDHAQSQRTQSLQRLRFAQANVMARDSLDYVVPTINKLLQHEQPFDVLISNPPYVSNHDYRTVTASSVRRFEPRGALVPQLGETNQRTRDGDQFYPRLLEIADLVDAKMILFEVGDHAQALRVATMAAEQRSWRTLEIWRDHLSANEGMSEKLTLGDQACSIIGDGHSRSVFAARGLFST